MASRVLGRFALGLTLTGALACRGDGGSARAVAPPAAAPAVPAALAPLADACTGGDARACYDLGVHFQVGDGVTLDYGQARALFERSCAAGDTYGCNGLGRLYQDGHGVDRDPARAMALYRQACDGGDAPVCYWVGYLEPAASSGRSISPARAATSIAPAPAATTTPAWRGRSRRWCPRPPSTATWRR